jgi:tRNA-binding protein
MSNISWADFEKVEIRTGTIIAVSDFPDARKPAYKLGIDFGELGIKKSSAQITTHYRKEDLVGKQVVAVVNFPPKQIGPFVSDCLVLGAIQADGSVILLQTEREVDNGLRIA